MRYEVIQREGHPYALIPLKAYEKLLEDSENLADVQAYDAVKARNEECFPVEIIEKLTFSGEHPLKIWREHRGLTQDQLAHAVGGISRAYLSEIERGKKPGSVKLLKAMADVLKVDVDMIIGYHE